MEFQGNPPPLKRRRRGCKQTLRLPTIESTSNPEIAVQQTSRGFNGTLKFVLPFLYSREYVQSLSRCSKYHYHILEQPEIHKILLDILQHREFFIFGTFPPIHQPAHIYSLLTLLHNLWRNQYDPYIRSIWTRCPSLLRHFYEPNGFVNRLAYYVIFGGVTPKLYGVSFWIQSISQCLGITMDHLYYHQITKTFLDVRTLHDVSVYELRSQSSHLLLHIIHKMQMPATDGFSGPSQMMPANAMRFDQQRNIKLYRQLIRWMADRFHFLPSPSEWLAILSNVQNVEFTVFVMHSICCYFELKLMINGHRDNGYGDRVKMEGVNDMKLELSSEYLYYFRNEMYHFVYQFAGKLNGDRSCYGMEILQRVVLQCKEYGIDSRFRAIWSKLQCMDFGQYMTLYYWYPLSSILWVLLWQNDYEYTAKIQSFPQQSQWIQSPSEQMHQQRIDGLNGVNAMMNGNDTNPRITRSTSSTSTTSTQSCTSAVSVSSAQSVPSVASVEKHDDGSGPIFSLLSSPTLPLLGKETICNPFSSTATL